ALHDDGGASSGGTDAGPTDAGVVDTGTPDTGTPDTGTPDTGVVDSGTPDTGTPDSGTPDAGGGPSATDPCGSTASPPAKYDHVVVIMNENRTWSTVGGTGFLSMPYLHSVAQKCTYFADWTETNTSQNSLNQYIGLTSGIAN